ncbi:MAG: H-NS histone family protein [Ramlibacter sp.]|nr:H-NS histone family protein [Ramlibacter sp.]
MPTYIELMEQAEKLLTQAEELRVKELAEVIADIRQKMERYGLTVQDLGLGPKTSKKKKGVSKSGGRAKYRGPNGQTWSGGRGRRPQWVVDALAKGKKLEDFAVK